MRMTCGVLAVLFLATAAAGCGQARKENAHLKAQLHSVQQENIALKTEAAALKADTQALHRLVQALSREKQALEERLHAAEARAAVQPGVRPVRPRRASSG
jgi:septal ring factor EnvC (AmiA/AmiB activator)